MKSSSICHFTRPVAFICDCESRQLSFMGMSGPFIHKGLPIYGFADAPHIGKCIRSSFSNWYTFIIIY